LRTYHPPQACYPVFDEDRLQLTIETRAGIERHATADLNGDGWTDAIITRMIWQTLEMFEITILLNDQQGGLVDATDEIFQGPIPEVQHPSRILPGDYNGDGRTDFFIADHGMDAEPFPGGQNILVLAVPGGKLVDATGYLPQQPDGTHSAAAADIDADGDVDLYIGNLGAGGGVPPQIWLNDGSGGFTVAQGLLPAEQTDIFRNWYTASAFADVNSDGFPDLILGQCDPTSFSHVLLNDGMGQFTKVETALPPTVFHPDHGAMDIKALDMNADGFLDLFLVDTRANAVGRYIQVLMNNGDGTFVDETSTRMYQTYDDGWVRYLELVDLNYDGHMDLVAVQMVGPGPMFYLNNGHGVFREWDHGLDLGGNFEFLDIDRDGWRDILLSGTAFDGWPEWHAIMRHIGCRDPAS
jgi:hypothetical protein